MRLFYALRVPEPERLRPVYEAARSPALSVARVEQLHFTLAFLGETSLLDEAILAGEAVRGFSPFELAISGAGAFPSPKRPRVLWLGVSHGADELIAVATALHGALRSHGVSLEERQFRPHLTLARVKPGGEREAQRVLAALPPAELARFQAQSIALMQSTLGRGGATHTVVREIRGHSPISR